MIKKYPYLTDKEFLKEIDESLVLSEYVKIILLNWNEQPIQTIEGRITGGSISINGDSSIRRTCNLNTFVEDDSYNYNSLDSLFSLNKKVIIEIGINNITDKYTDYPIIWFPQGHYVIMGLSLNHQTSGTSISLNLKDKMVLLNGECGGTFPASVTFDRLDEYDENTKTTITKQVPIYQIIQELVNHFGEIPLGQILINDIDLEIRQVMKWVGNVPLYQYISIKDNLESYEYTTVLKTKKTPTKIFENGEDVGYIYTDFVYPDELIGEAGQTVCDILDKIKNTLGNYEYFFDIYGNFVFQEKKNYLNTRQTTVQLQGYRYNNYLIQMKEGMSVYKFNNSQLITSISNTPKYDNIKNDFIVWGKRKTINGEEIPIRYHLAIDEKPALRSNQTYLELYEDEYKIPRAKISPKGYPINVADWRTEIYIRGLEANINATAAPYYFLELDNEWRQIYDLKNMKFTDEAIARPYEINYFLDFIDTDSAIGQYSISNIGRRTTVLVDDTINCLFEPEIPNVIFIKNSDTTTDIDKIRRRGENVTQVNDDIYDNLYKGGYLNSAFVAIKDLLYQYTSYNENISISMVPIFHLEPNTRINIIDNQSGTNGDFIITNINIPLDIGGTMSVSANRALEKI